MILWTFFLVLWSMLQDVGAKSYETILGGIQTDGYNDLELFIPNNGMALVSELNNAGDTWSHPVPVHGTESHSFSLPSEIVGSLSQFGLSYDNIPNSSFDNSSMFIWNSGSDDVKAWNNNASVDSSKLTHDDTIQEWPKAFNDADLARARSDDNDRQNNTNGAPGLPMAYAMCFTMLAIQTL